jgi:lysophospholipase L1-like esterase
MQKLTGLLLILLVFNSCKKESPAEPAVVYNNVVILGNSITFSPADASINWNGNWGMAATAANKDYVYLLTERFKSYNPACTVSIKNIAQFEREFSTYAIDGNLKIFKDRKPDLLIIRIGENVTDGFNATEFDNRYAVLISYFKTANPNLKVVAAGSFWTGKDAVDAVMQKHSPFISLSPLGLDMGNYAWGQFTDHGVQSHPSDRGMQAIADRIWNAIVQLP